MRHSTSLVRPLGLAVILSAGFIQTSFVAAQTKRKELTARQIAQRTFPSVVVLVAEDRAGDSYLGSGFFVDEDVIATNYHVIKAATKVVARRVGQKQVYRVSILSTDEERDLALLKLEGANARPLTFAKGYRVAVGDVVYVAGNPEGLEGTFSQGIVSALRGNDYLQITAPISHGSSGGPVLNTRGEVIGVAIGTIEQGQNLNFAVPISQLLPQVMRSRLLGRRPYSTDRASKLVGSKDEIPGPLAEGLRLSSQGRYAEAAEAFKNALRLKPDDTTALLWLADAYTSSDKYQEAIDVYHDLIRIHPSEEDQTRALLGLARSYEGLHKYQTAIDIYKDLMRTHPQEENAYLYLSLLLILDLQRHEEAIDVLKRGIRTIPKAFILYGSLATLLETQDRLPEAIGIYQLAVQKVDPNPTYLGSLHFGLGKAYLRIGDRSSAIKEYRLLKSLGSMEAEWLFEEIYK